MKEDARNSYIITPPKHALSKYAMYKVTANPEYPKPVAFCNKMDGRNVQGLLDLILATEDSFKLEVRP